MTIPIPSLPNRRIPNGTYGGVRGRRLATASYLIKRAALLKPKRDHVRAQVLLALTMARLLLMPQWRRAEQFVI